MIADDITEEQFEKATGQLRLALNKVMKPLRLYGQNHYVDTVTEEIISLAVQYYQRLSGVDLPYIINDEKLHW